MAKNYEEMSDEEFSQEAPPEIEETSPAEEKVEESTEQEENIPESSEEPTEPEEKIEDQDQEPSKEEQAPEVDYKGFYEAMMSPIKANGKDFQARTPEEAVRLMQMGANYTQKMQTIAPYRKKIQMLQNAGLLEDEKLNYLIDLSQGNKG